MALNDTVVIDHLNVQGEGAHGRDGQFRKDSRNNA